MRFKVGELAVIGISLKDRLGHVVEILEVGPMPVKFRIEGIRTMDYRVTGINNHPQTYAYDWQLIKLSDPDKEEELTEELEHAHD